ncbi:MAG: AAA family ATPase [Pseudomonadota bacterium]
MMRAHDPLKNLPRVDDEPLGGQKGRQPHRGFDYHSTPDSEQVAWRIQSAAEFTADFTAPEWLVEGVIQRGKFYTLTAPTGHAKTAAMLYIGAQISIGGEVCALDTEPGDVLFLAGENPDDVRARVIVALDRYGIDPERCRLHFVPGTFSIRQDMERLKRQAASLPDLALIVVDTFAAYFDGDDENSNAQALEFAHIVRQLAALPSRPAVVMPAHPVKNATKGNLIPKGGSSLLNEVDGNLTIWKEDGVASLHWQGKIRGPDFDPIRLEIQIATHPKVTDKRGVLMPSVVALPVLEMRAKALAQEAMSREDRVLLSIEKWPGMSVADRCIEVGMMNADGSAMKSTMQRILTKLKEAKLIRKPHREWVLTKDGQIAVEAIKAGQAGEEMLEH